MPVTPPPEMPEKSQLDMLMDAYEKDPGGTALTGQMGPTAGQTITLPFNPVGWFETSDATLLNMELGGSQSGEGALVYIEV